MCPQVGIDQLDVHPELAEHNGLSQPLLGIPSSLQNRVGDQTHVVRVHNDMIVGALGANSSDSCTFGSCAQ